ncbi:MAG: hypothetical protein WCI75_00275 [candidate division NC10 bacterium]
MAPRGPRGTGAARRAGHPRRRCAGRDHARRTRGPIPALRATLATELVTTLGLSLAEVARQLGVTTSAILQVVRRSGGE